MMTKKTIICLMALIPLCSHAEDCKTVTDTRGMNIGYLCTDDKGNQEVQDNRKNTESYIRDGRILDERNRTKGYIR